MPSQTAPSSSLHKEADPSRRATPGRKVMHLVVAGDIGGAERFLIDLASRPALSEAEHLIVVISPNAKLPAYFREAGLNVIFRPSRSEGGLGYLSRSFGPREVAWLSRLVRDQNVDLLHLHTFASHVLGARVALACEIPAVRTEHGVRHYRDPTCAIYRRWALRNTARIAAVSAFVASVVVAVEPSLANRISVVHNGVDAMHFQPQARNAAAPVTALVLSRLEREKRVEIAILALPLVPGIRLRIAGEGSRRDALVALARRIGVSDRVEFLGYQPNPRQAIAEADVLLNCTRHEGLGLSILEAAAMQRPAIAFQGGGVPEVIDDARSGWLVKSDGPEALAAVLSDVASDRELMERCGFEARHRVERDFSVEAMCGKYAEIYRELTGGIHRNA